MIFLNLFTCKGTYTIDWVGRLTTKAKNWSRLRLDISEDIIASYTQHSWRINEFLRIILDSKKFKGIEDIRGCVEDTSKVGRVQPIDSIDFVQYTAAPLQKRTPWLGERAWTHLCPIWPPAPSRMQMPSHVTRHIIQWIDFYIFIIYSCLRSLRSPFEDFSMYWGTISAFFAEYLQKADAGTYCSI